MLGKLLFEEEEIDFYDPNKENLVDQVSIRKKQIYGKGKYRILLVDCGVKNNIIRNLLKRDVTVVRVPWNYDFTKEKYDGLFISNGPGNPVQCQITINNLKKSFEKVTPIFGICLGNQLMALASGATTYKMKYGHRSHNQPVLMVGTDKAYITSQNHGFAVDSESLNDTLAITHISLFDKSLQGLRRLDTPAMGFQGHPEASPGPHDVVDLFDQFLKLLPAA